MKAVIFAAGLGTRLGKFTQDKPKALVEVQGRSMLFRVMDRIRMAGIKDFVVNVHAFASMVDDALRVYQAEFPELRIEISDERDLLLETGGGLKKMSTLLQEGPFLVHNVDILSDINLEAFIQKSLKSNSLASLAVRKTESDRYFLFDDSMQLCGWENVKTGQKKISRDLPDLQRFGFMGIHLIRPEIFDWMEEEGKFSITDVYLRLAKAHRIDAQDCSHFQWMDIGSVEQLAKAEDVLMR